MFSNIRPIEQSDLEQVIALLREFAEQESLSEYCIIDEDKLFAVIFGDDAIVKGFVALAHERVVGYTLTYPSFSSFRGEMSYHVEDLYVTANFRGKGVGEALLRTVAQLAARNGWSRLDLMVHEQNERAIKFYKRLGAQTNPHDRHFKFSGQAFSDLLNTTPS